MAASQDREDAFRTLSVDDDGGAVKLTGSRAVLDEFGAATLGQTPVAIALPEALTGQLDALQNAGGNEVWAIGKDATLLAALKYGIDKGVAQGSQDLQNAFAAAKKQLRWFKDAAVRIVEWVVNKLRSLLPTNLQTAFDDKLKDLEGKLSDGAEALLGDALGKMFGRGAAEDAWERAVRDQVDVSGAEAKLPTVISGEITRIGYVSRTRQGVKTISGVLAGTATVTGLGLDLQLILGALAVTMVLVVFSQLWAGFNDITNLVPATGA